MVCRYPMISPFVPQESQKLPVLNSRSKSGKSNPHCASAILRPETVGRCGWKLVLKYLVYISIHVYLYIGIYWYILVFDIGIYWWSLIQMRKDYLAIAILGQVLEILNYLECALGISLLNVKCMSLWLAWLAMPKNLRQLHI